MREPVVREPYRPDTEPISSAESAGEPDDVTVSAAWPLRRDIAAIDLVLAMESMPGHNAGAVADVLRRRFQLPDAEAHVVRRRLADLMVYERRMVGELQSLLPTGDPAAVDCQQAVGRVRRWLSAHDGRPTTMPIDN